MYKKIFSLLVLFGLFGNLYGQNELNPYKYIIVKKQYEFQKSENQYRLNSLTKFNFDKRGFTTTINGNQYPDDLHDNPCLGLTADVVDVSNILVLKVQIVLKDCRDATVYQTIIGRSKEKLYEDAYKEALEKCFVSIDSLDYSYDPSLNKVDANKKVPTAAPVAVVAAEQKAVEPVQKEVEPAKEAKPSDNAEVEMVAVAAVPIVTESESEAKQTESSEEKSETKESVIASTYYNENISFFLIEQEGVMKAYVNESKNANYKKGEMIGSFEKTSLPNVFRVSWKKKDQNIDETTAYFDDQGNLKVDIRRNGQLETLTFKKE